MHISDELVSEFNTSCIHVHSVTPDIFPFTVVEIQMDMFHDRKHVAILSNELEELYLEHHSIFYSNQFKYNGFFVCV